MMNDLLTPDPLCPFCESKIADLSLVNCPTCHFPLNGTAEEKSAFEAENKELKYLIDEAETALSWARFFMLWPAVGLGTYTITIALYFFNLYLVSGNLVMAAILGGLFFVAARKPLPAMLLTVLMLVGILLLNYLSGQHSLVFWILITVVLISQLNGIYCIYRMEKALEARR